MRVRSSTPLVFVVLIAIVVAIVAAGVTAVAFRIIPASAGAAGQTTVTGTAIAGPRDTITVIGEGTQLATPDVATLNLGVQPKRSTVRDALAAENTEMTKLLDNIKAAGVAEADIQTNSISITQNTDCCPSRISGYTASNSVVVKIHHLSNVSTVVAAAADAVGDDIALNGVTLDLNDRASQLKGARESAMAAASTKAKHWASLAGRHLGKVLSVSELVSTTSPSGSPCGGYGGCGGGGGAPVQAGQSSVLVDVTVVYELTG
jgi:uncharacterized protein YggE